MSADSSARGRLPRGLRHARRPAHDAALEIVVRDLVLARADAPAHRDPGLVHGLGVARNEWVPPVEVASLGQKAIGATRRQPHDSFYISGGYPNAILHLRGSVGIVAATARVA